MNLNVGILSFIFCISFIFGTGCITHGVDDNAGYEKWNLTLEWDEKKNHLTLSDLKNMYSYTGYGYLVSTTGIKYGPFVGKGVPLYELNHMIGVTDEFSSLYLYGSDEYLWVLDHDQIFGENFITFNENLSEIKDQNITPVLMYEQDGKPLSYEDGGPVRLALLTDREGVITEGSGWVKWISRIELHK
ncbi:molybdopterin-dependent oxidoreductase [Methanospirillum sp.]